MHSELENLINMAIADGEVTEKEREVILRKAEKLGEDKDEVEMILNGKVALMKKDKSPKSNKEGDIKKCPSCGSSVASFSTTCKDCGHEFRNTTANKSIQELFLLLNEIENSRKVEVSNPLTSMGKSFASVLEGKGAFIMNNDDSKKIEIIKNFPIPNTKEDILEFLSLAIPKAQKKGGFWGGFGSEVSAIAAHNALVPVWHSKCESIVIKARVAMKDDKDSLKIIENYAKQLGIK
jgi:hypothetical protein